MPTHSSTTVQKPASSARQHVEDRAKAEALFNSVGEGVLSTNEAGELERVNDVALRMLGYRRKEVIGKWYPGTVEAVHADGTPIKKLDRPITRSFLTGKAVTDRIYYRRKDGSTFPVHVSVAPIMVHKKPVGAIEIFRDISVEMELDRSKSDFMSLASHQLRTPLSAINTYSNMLSEGYAGELTKEQMSFIEIILSAAGRMNDLINVLLNVSRIETGTIIVKVRPTNIVNLARELIGQFHAEAATHHLTITLDSDIVHPKIKTDSLLVKEVLSNFLSNALKYSPHQGEIQVKVTEDAENLTICITDHGIGIPSDAQSFVFSKFFRAANVTKHDVSGTGLGLYLTKVIAENLDGEIWFTSQEGKGSSFYLSLPKQGTTDKAGKFKLETS